MTSSIGRLPDHLRQALDSEIDATEAFTERVGVLRQQLSKQLEVRVKQDVDMNYNAGQRLVVLFDFKGRPTSEDQQGNFKLVVGVSSRGPLFALVRLYKLDHQSDHGSGSTWRPSEYEQISQIVSETYLTQIRKVMQQANLIEVGQDELVRPSGYSCELDGGPASIEQALFCELC